MKSQFSTSWISSKQPRKQRKYRYNAPLHLKRKFLSAHLSKSLHEKHKIGSLEVRKGDEVSIMRGSFKKKTGKISRVDLKSGKVYVENISTTKRDGTKVLVPLQPSNLQLISLSDDGKRFSKSTKKEKKETGEKK